MPDALSDILKLTRFANERGYTILEIQATMGDMLSIVSIIKPLSIERKSIEDGDSIMGYPYRIGEQIALICSDEKAIQ